MITVFTPTYNRQEQLRLLYSSLLQQTNTDFEWLIIDDGSTDNTKAMVTCYVIENKIKVRYYYQENQGKHIAFNSAIEKASGHFFICVDSDDILVPTAIEIFSKVGKMSFNNIAGFAFARKYSEHIDQDTWNKIDNKDIDIIDLKEIYGIVESAILFNTNILRKFRFPVKEDYTGTPERFCSEGLLYNQFIGRYKFIAKKEVVYIGQYLTEGLTDNLFTQTWVNSPNNVLLDLNFRYKISAKYEAKRKWIIRVKTIMNINALCLKTGKSLANNTPSKILSIVLFIPSLIFKKIRFG